MAATTTKAVRIGVIGVGRIGRMHAELLARQVPGARLTAVHDADADTARSVAGALGVTAAADRRRAALRADVDAVAICTPTATHADLIVAAARAGQGDLLREAGVAGPGRGRPRAGRGAATAGVPFQIGFNRRFDPGHAAVAAAVADGTVGEPQLARITSRDPAPPPTGVHRARPAGSSST